MIALFDKHWEDDGQSFGGAPRDPKAYTTGVIGMHNVVVAHMPSMETVSAGRTEVAAYWHASPVREPIQPSAIALPCCRRALA